MTPSLGHLVKNITALDSHIGAVEQTVEGVGKDVDALFTLICAFMVLGMQAGFAFVEAGSIVANLRSILMKNVLDVCLCTLSWWVIGYGLARGTKIFNGFLGYEHPFHLPETGGIAWFFDLSFVATSATIVSGAMAERTKFVCYVVFTLLISGIIYPLVCHWVWSDQGFMKVGNPAAQVPILDFAGCGVVHMVGGISGLSGAWVVGPRPGIFIHRANLLQKKDIYVHDRLLATQKLWMVIGTLGLWVGWYGFNCGSVGGIVGQVETVALVAINTTVAAIVGAVAAAVVSHLHHKIFVIDKVLLGILAGLVSVTAGAPYYYPPAAAVIGLVGFFAYYLVEMLLYKLEIDDPVSAFPVHGVCGFWGLVSAGLFQVPDLSGAPKSYGIQLLMQLLGACIIAAWSLCTSLTAFLCLKKILRGSIRILHAEHEFMQEEEEYPRIGPKGVVTLLFTDIQSSTALWEADEYVMAEALMLHDHVMRSNLKEFNGFEVKTEGDAFMGAFGNCLDACRYCTAVQHQLLTTKWPKAIYSNMMARVQDDDQGRIIWKGLRVRMGFHTGEPNDKENPVTTRTDYFGRDVNYAARVSSIGAGGQILISSASLRDMLPFYSSLSEPLQGEPPFGMEFGERYEFAELKCYVEYIGRFKLKGITTDNCEGEHLYQIVPFGLETRHFGNLRLDAEEEASAVVALPRPNLQKKLSRGSSMHRRAPQYSAGTEMAIVDVAPSSRPSINRLMGDLDIEELEVVGSTNI
uniref:Guanylate cyclase domain-containing protein n=1 Tax=Eutreptiella gymnastica TaxID=73025 RepID=A0A6T1ZNL6_9EUGL